MARIPVRRVLRRHDPGRLGSSDADRYPVWLSALDPVARVLFPGTRTAGSAGSGRREFYGVTTARTIQEIDGRFRGEHFGGLTRMQPRVTFGFASPPARPSLVAVTTTIRMPPPRDGC